MIGKLSGRIDYRSDDHILLDVRGVGYMVYCSDRTLAALPSVGEAVALYTDLVVREDLLQLFGFPTLVEKEWHRLLMSVQGIGAKASLSILGALGADGVSRAIALGDWNAIKAAKGIGPKTAQRVVIELKDKAPTVMAMAGQSATPAAVTDDVIEADAPVPQPAPTPNLLQCKRMHRQMRCQRCKTLVFTVRGSSGSGPSHGGCPRNRDIGRHSRGPETMAPKG